MPGPCSPQTTIVTRHEIHVAGQTIAYTAEAGRIVLRDEKTGEVSGHMFFTAYHVAGKDRPVTFLWNGGPGANSAALHFEALGPRRISDGKFIDNDATLLTTSDLVFVDPIGTGFSRSANATDDAGFYSTLGDFAAADAFVRGWLAQHHREHAPVDLLGESFGVWRAAGAAELLESHHQPVAGIVLISGGAGVGTGKLPRTLVTALRTPTRAATALFYGKLAPDLGTEVGPVVDEATAWAKTHYAPALEHVDLLTDAERDAIVRDLVRFTGLKPDDRLTGKTLSVSPRAYLGGLLKDESKSSTPSICARRASRATTRASSMTISTTISPTIRRSPMRASTVLRGKRAIRPHPRRAPLTGIGITTPASSRRRSWPRRKQARGRRALSPGRSTQSRMIPSFAFLSPRASTIRSKLFGK